MMIIRCIGKGGKRLTTSGSLCGRLRWRGDVDGLFWCDGDGVLSVGCHVGFFFPLFCCIIQMVLIWSGLAPSTREKQSRKGALYYVFFKFFVVTNTNDLIIIHYVTALERVSVIIRV